MGLSQINLAIIGASGYTGADAVRLLAAHPRVRIAALTGNAHAGRNWRKYIRNLPILMCRRYARRRCRLDGH